MGVWVTFITLSQGWAAEEPLVVSLVVGRIEIVGLVNTHPDVVRREFLMKPGEPFQPRLLEESRRRIQALPLVKTVLLETVTAGGLVDITCTVTSKNSWEVATYTSYGGDNITVGGRVHEGNLLGGGTGVTGEYSFNTFKRHYGALEIEDKYFFPESPIGVRLKGGLGQDGQVIGGTVWRSPRWVGEEWTYEVGGTYQQDTVRQFDNGLVVGIYSAELTIVPIKVGRAWVDDHTHYGLTVGTRFEQAQFIPGAIPTVTPSNRTRLIFMADAQVATELPVKERWYNALGDEEEIMLGNRSSIGWEHATAGVLSDLTYHTIRIAQGQDYRLGSLGYLFLNVGVEGRMETRDLTNLTTSLQGRLALRTLPVGFLVGRMVIDALLKNENRSQLMLGSDTGLRGYQVNRFSGEKRWLLNLEQRALLLRAGLVDVGGVIFTDMGHVFKESELMDPRLFNTSVGMGVRITSQKFSFPMGRLDVGYGLTDRVWVVSVGTNQYF